MVLRAKQVQYNSSTTIRDVIVHISFFSVITHYNIHCFKLIEQIWHCTGIHSIHFFYSFNWFNLIFGTNSVCVHSNCWRMCSPWSASRMTSRVSRSSSCAEARGVTEPLKGTPCWPRCWMGSGLRRHSWHPRSVDVHQPSVETHSFTSTAGWRGQFLFLVLILKLNLTFDSF